MMRISCWAALAVLSFSPADAVAQKKKGGKYEQMDYGPFITATITAPLPGKNTADKGLALKLGKDAAVCFDMDLLRYSAAWTGGFLNLRGTPFDGSHGGHPTIKGRLAFATADRPGWATPGTTEFKDSRSEPYGPLPEDWARYHGFYLSGERGVFHYTVGKTKILDAPSFVQADGIDLFTRTLQIGPSALPLAHAVAVEAAATAKADGKLATLEKGSELVAALIGGEADGVTWKAEEGRLVLVMPARKAASTLVLSVARIAKGKLNDFRALASKQKPADIAALLKGGPARWKETVTVKGVLSKAKDAYVVDTIPVPEANPYKSWMRIGGLDFFADGRAAVCTWSGDVWVVSGIDATLEKVEWKRFATGLFQPLGLKIVGGKIHVLGREGIVKLHDLNGDGEADHYEAFNTDVATTPGFHEFAFDLQTDPEGNFYYAKAGPVRGGGRGFEYIARHSGCILKVSPDGKKHEVFATGFRAPNGIGVGPRGEVTSGDNEGTWMPMCRLSLVKPGSFNGCVDTAHRQTPPTWYDQPICWMPKNIDNSSGGQVWVTSDKWGPLKGSLLHMSYGTSSIYQVLMEGEGKTLQGGLVKLPLRFLSGVMRARFNPKDGQLYVAGLRGWQTNAAKDACLQRVRYTGEPFNGLLGMKVVKEGLELTFAQPMDAKTAGDAEDYAAQAWNYLWCSNYGSPEYKLADDFDARVKEYNKLRSAKKRDGKAIQEVFKTFVKGRDRVEIKAAKLSADGKTVTLSMPGLKRAMQMNVKMRVKTAAGAPVNLEIYNTVNRVP